MGREGNEVLHKDAFASAVPVDLVTALDFLAGLVHASHITCTGVTIIDLSTFTTLVKILSAAM